MGGASPLRHSPRLTTNQTSRRRIPTKRGGEVGHFVANFVIRGEDGFKGKLKARFFNTPGGGREVEMISGDCEFIEE